MIAAVVCVLAVAGCGGQAAPPRRVSDHRGAKSQATRSPRETLHVSYRRLYALPAPLQDPASAPVGASGFVLAGGLTAADTSSNQVIAATGHGAQVTGSLPNA